MCFVLVNVCHQQLSKSLQQRKVADYISPPLDGNVAFRLSSNDHYVWINDDLDKAVVPPARPPTPICSETLTNRARHCLRNTSTSYASTIPGIFGTFPYI
jgi:hypothetical protein